jgi:hypothetical protein
MYDMHDSHWSRNTKRMQTRARSLIWTVAGAALGMFAVAMFVGARIGLAQSGQWPAWLAASLGALIGPMYLYLDIMDLLAGTPVPLIVLPAALPGGLLGGIAAWLLAKSEAKREAGEGPHGTNLS